MSDTILPSIIGTIDNTLTGVRNRASRGQFFLWTDRGPIVSDFDTGDVSPPAAGTYEQGSRVDIDNLRLYVGVDVETYGDDIHAQYITNGIPLGIITGGVIPRDELSYIWTARAGMFSVSAGTGLATPSFYIDQLQNIIFANIPILAGNYILAYYIKIAPAELTEDVDDTNINYMEYFLGPSIAEDIYFGRFEATDSQLSGLVLSREIPEDTLILQNQNALTPDGVPDTNAWYANIGPPVNSVTNPPLYNNHAFFWRTINNQKNIAAVQNWIADPEDIPNNLFCANCPDDTVCDSTTGLCITQEIQPPPDNGPVAPPVEAPEIAEDGGFPTWGYIAIVAGVIIVIIVIALLIYFTTRSDKKEDKPAVRRKQTTKPTETEMQPEQKLEGLSCKSDLCIKKNTEYENEIQYVNSIPSNDVRDVEAEMLYNKILQNQADLGGKFPLSRPVEEFMVNNDPRVI